RAPRSRLRRMTATCSGSATKRRRSSSSVHTEIEPLRRRVGSDQSQRPTAPGIAYQPIRSRSPVSVTPGTWRQRAIAKSVTLTTTGPLVPASGPGAQRVHIGTSTSGTPTRGSVAPILALRQDPLCRWIRRPIQTLLVALDRSQPRGLRRQLASELRRAIQDGRLPAGARLPPS